MKVFKGQTRKGGMEMRFLGQSDQVLLLVRSSISSMVAHFMMSIVVVISLGEKCLAAERIQTSHWDFMAAGPAHDEGS